ncbi:ubiquitin-conjugating enzyme E2 11-like isoform X3 [Haliotis rubra]|uniref:ubiquitin-conjugating enzyme E2 11-like isoform X3 n=1 Tax=Haliotis rubra TaxID=36100 RepID=UPI001EE5F583|nr:ubiquitin-conjugating enzyme E2 11-like isoform X3 [Haliotis rubra]
MALRRIYKEWQDCVEHPMEGISFKIPYADNSFYWDAIIEGPVKFKTPVYHPNIHRKGFLNLEILKETWSPALTIAKVLLCVRCLLVDDINADDPLEPDIARLYKTDRAKYKQTVREWTKKYAM